ncbi:hypothetical protein ACNI3Q_08765 [Sphingomonas sp. FW199]|uniref:hypothetical protein n=1 Tax=Sphingomonas sp. FW199 TaxID=3400217 RepID=UPI003CECA20E
MRGAPLFAADLHAADRVHVLGPSAEVRLTVDLLARAGIDAVARTVGDGPVPPGAPCFIDIAGLSPDAADAMLAMAGTPGRGWVMSAPLDAIDHMMTLAGDSGAALLCDPDDADRMAAIQLAMWHGRTPVREGGDDMEAQLRRLNEEVARMARVLADLAQERDALADRRRDYAGPPPDADIAPVRAITASDLKAAIRARRLRERYFPADLFGDPAWDMMLDLLLAELEHRRVPVSSLCIAAAVPSTTALRWIGQMTQQGLLVREADALDRRRSYITLSPDTGIRLRRLLGTLAEQGLPIP